MQAAYNCLLIDSEASAYTNRLLLQENKYKFKLTQLIIQSGQQSNVSDASIDIWKFFPLETINRVTEILEDEENSG